MPSARKTDKYSSPRAEDLTKLYRWLTAMLLFSLTLVVAAHAHAQPAAEENKTATSYSALADLLENDETRARLITELRALAPSAEAAPAPRPKEKETASVAAPAPAETSGVLFSRNIANSIEQFITSISHDISQASIAFRALSRDGAVEGLDRKEITSLLVNFAIVVAATLAAFFIFRRIAAGFYARSNMWVTGAGRPSEDQPELEKHAPHSRTGLYRKSIAIVSAMVVDTVAILLAGVVGYLVGLFAIEKANEIGTLESLFINAFVAIEIAKAIVRGIFAPRYDQLRLFRMNDDIAAYWGRWLEQLINFIGYGILVFVPLAKSLLSPMIGHLLGVFIMLGVYVYAVRVIWKNRSSVRERLERQAQSSATAFFSTLIRMLARTWHTLAIIYFTVLLVASQIAPTEALPFMAEATLQTLIAIGLGLLLSAIANALLSRRVSLSEELRARLPMLELRLNSYIPAVLKGMNLLLAIVVVLVVLDAWNVFNLALWVASEGGRATIIAVVHSAIVLVIAAIIWTIVASIIEHRLSPGPGRGEPSEREKTLLSLFRNAALVVIVTLTILVVLSQIGIDIAPLIAGAGVAGLAIGFGAQKLVQDVITGVFIQLENGMYQNDVVSVAGIFGVVEKITIRSVGIRTLDGGFHMIPFSSVDKVSNHTRDFSYHYGEYAIAYREDVDNAIHHLKLAFEELMKDEEIAGSVLEEISIPGVSSLHERGYNIRVLIKTLPGMQWTVQRAFNRLVKKYFDAAGIELPYPHTVLYFGQDKNGKVPTAPMLDGNNTSPPQASAAASG